MITTVQGVVTNGVVVPHGPLPEGAEVEIYVHMRNPKIPSDLQDELDDWERAGAGTLELVERLAENLDEKR